MFKRILLPLDGSQAAEMALPYGEELAGGLGSELVLYHVHAPEQQKQEHTHQVYLDRVAETVRNSIKKGHAKSGEGKVTTVVEAGEPTQNICRLVDENKVDLIVMTSVSPSGLKLGKLLGSVTDYVCRTVPIPVMIIRPQNMRRPDLNGRLINHVLITLDGSDLSRLALPAGEELASKLNVRTTLFEMARMITLYGDVTGSTAYVDYTKLDADEKTQVENDLVRTETELRQRGLNVNHVVTSGWDAANEIIDVSKQTGVDLVVMSSHGRSGLGRWLLGSVAEKVLRHGETPLLLVRARAPRP